MNNRPSQWRIISLSLIVSVFAPCYGKEIRITPNSDIEPIAKSLKAGDSVVLSDGPWNGIKLTFDRLAGTVDSPIQIRSESPGGAVLTGETEFQFSGHYVIVSGLVFRNVVGVSDVVQLRAHSERHAHNCRITDCVFEQTANSDAGAECRWLSVYGTNNRIDHCYFVGKKSRGPTFVVWVAEERGSHRIDHNYFGPRPELGKNGGETIRIGTSEVSELDCGTVVEENYFHKCDGEAEIISNKSCANTYRHNVFDECSGALTLRHGHRCMVDGNVFLGRESAGTGGVRIIGREHVVTNNYFEGLRGDAERAAICLMNGVPNGPLNGYAPVVGAVVSHNTLVDCKVAFELGHGAGKKQSASPASCRISHNAVQPEKWQVFRVHSMPVGTEWSGNLLQPGKKDSDLPIEFERRQFGLKRSDDGLLRPQSLDAIRTGTNTTVDIDMDGFPRSEQSLAGCDDPTNQCHTMPSPGNTGPTWRLAAH
jgi:poly(beta-D-mannuronate) lyase